MSRRLYPIRMLWPLLAMLCGLGSCTKEIDIRPRAEVQVVASCILANTDVQHLKLSYSKEMGRGHYFDEVEQATATLYEEGIAVGVFTKVGYGDWELHFRPTPERHYRLEVELPQRPTLRATTTMPSPVAVRRKRGLRSPTTRTFIQRQLSEPYWILCLRSSLKELPADPQRLPTLEQDPKVDLFKEIATDHRRVDQFNGIGELSKWDPDHQQAALYHYYTRVVPPRGGEKELPYEFVVQHAPVPASFVVFRAASAEYDRYLRSVIEKMQFYESEGDPSAWFDQTVVYSNIEHGLGIFGAYYQTAYYYHEALPI